MSGGSNERGDFDEIRLGFSDHWTHGSICLSWPIVLTPLLFCFDDGLRYESAVVKIRLALVTMQPPFT